MHLSVQPIFWSDIQSVLPCKSAIGKVSVPMVKVLSSKSALEIPVRKHCTIPAFQCVNISTSRPPPREEKE